MNTQAKKFMLTKQGYEHLQDEYQDLVKIKREEVVDRIERAREFGDLAENSAYDSAKEEQSLIEARIADLEEVLHKAQVVQLPLSKDIIIIGSTVLVEMNNEIHEFSIVGSMEADPAENKISNESPVGKSLLGLKVSESIEVALGPVKSQIKVLEIK